MSFQSKCVVMVWNDHTVEVCATTIRDSDDACYAMRRRLHGKSAVTDPRWQIVPDAQLVMVAPEVTQ